LKQPHLILGMGELLWDQLPEGAFLGGAPANFAGNGGTAGNRAVLAEPHRARRVGPQGGRALNPMPANTHFLQMDPARETGRVTVSFEGGEPHLHHPPAGAWDFLELTGEWLELAERADASASARWRSALRNRRQTIQALAARTPATI